MILRARAVTALQHFLMDAAAALRRARRGRTRRGKAICSRALRQLDYALLLVSEHGDQPFDDASPAIPKACAAR